MSAHCLTDVAIVYISSGNRNGGKISIDVPKKDLFKIRYPMNVKITVFCGRFALKMMGYLVKSVAILTAVVSLSLAACTPLDVVDESPESYKKEALLTAEAANLPVFIRGIEVGHPNSAGGVSVNIKGHNFGGKEIKYIRYQVTPYNRVGDKVAGEIRRRSTTNLTETGPIPHGSNFGAFSEWANVWYNHQISCVRLNRIKIEYTDGSSRTIAGKDKIERLLRYDVRNPAC